MKSIRFTLPLILISLCAVSIAQSAGTVSDTQKSFDQLKTLAGTWQASVTTDPPMKDMGDGAVAQVSLRVTSLGNALVHELSVSGRSDHPVTMFYWTATACC